MIERGGVDARGSRIMQRNAAKAAPTSTVRPEASPAARVGAQGRAARSRSAITATSGSVYGLHPAPIRRDGLVSRERCLQGVVCLSAVLLRRGETGAGR